MKTICPTAAPGDAGSPVASTSIFRSFFIQTRNQKVVKLVGLDAEDCLFFRDQTFFHHLDGDSHRGRPVRLPLRVCSMYSLPSWMVNSKSCISR